MGLCSETLPQITTNTQINRLLSITNASLLYIGFDSAGLISMTANLKKKNLPNELLSSCLLWSTSLSLVCCGLHLHPKFHV